MTKEKKYLISVAEKLCIPAIEKAVNNLLQNKPYLIIDHVSLECTKLEELLRPLWGIAPLLKEKKYYINVCGEKRELCEVLREIVLAGSDENNDICFSRYAENRDVDGFANQMITEFAGYCLALVIAPEVLWDPYTDEEKKRFSAWIVKWAVTALKHSWRNNHFWFPMLSVIALEKLGIDCGDIGADLDDGFSVLDTMYLENGWYQDGDFGRFDFYLAWSHHVYPLLWAYLSEGTPYYDAERTERYKSRTAEFFDYYVHMFDVDGGVPAFGRSLSYRFAQSSFFAAAAFTDCDVNYGLARRALVKNVSYFMDNMILPEDDVLPPGYLYASPSMAENYTSTGGAYWCAKTFLVLALPDDHPFWTAPEEKLPSEVGSFLINSKPENINMMLENTKEAGVTLYNNTAKCYNMKWGCGGRFNDVASCYSKFVYNSRSGFAMSSIDMISLDNMISLETWDAIMTSHRTGYTDEGIVDGFLVSRHVPFANDPDSYIKTWMLPLGDGFHVRAHKVVLSREYRVLEGGFSVGTFDDGSVTDITAEYASYSDGKGKISKMRTVSDTPFHYRTNYHMPGMHILAPGSAYPVYVTELLEKGEYRFASVFAFSTLGKIDKENEPEITLDGNNLTVKYKGEVKTAVLD